MVWAHCAHLLQAQRLKARIRELRRLHKTIVHRKNKLRQVIENRGDERFTIKEFPRRYFLSLEDKHVDTEQDAWRTASKMERFRAENSGEPLQISATSSYTVAND